MLRDVRPVRANGVHWRSYEATGEQWFYCHTHDFEVYGPKADVMAAAARHCPEIAERMAR